MARKGRPQEDANAVIRWFEQTAASHGVPTDRLPTCVDLQEMRLERFDKLRRRPE